MRLIRGSGSRGLSGIRPVLNYFIIRPLIETNRSDVEKYLQSKGIGWVEDSTNTSKEFLRNRIRQELLVQLEDYNPRIRETLARTADIVRDEEEFIVKQALNNFDGVFSQNNSELFGDLRRYQSIDKVLRFILLRIGINKLNGNLKNISSRHVVSADDFLCSDNASGEICLPKETVIAKGYRAFLITKRSELERTLSYTIQSTGRWSFFGVDLCIKYLKASEFDERDKSMASFDPKSVQFPIEVRSFRKGDRFFPLGMNTSKKLQDFFTDVKLPKFLRLRVPIFTCNEEIIWVGGMRIDDRFKVKDKEGKVLKIKLIEPGFASAFSHGKGYGWD